MFFIKIILLYLLLVIVQYLYFHIINKNIYKQLKNVNYINKKYNLNLSGNELKKLSIYLILTLYNTLGNILKKKVGK